MINQLLSLTVYNESTCTIFLCSLIREYLSVFDEHYIFLSSKMLQQVTASEVCSSNLNKTFPCSKICACKYCILPYDHNNRLLIRRGVTVNCWDSKLYLYRSQFTHLGGKREVIRMWEVRSQTSPLTSFTLCFLISVICSMTKDWDSRGEDDPEPCTELSKECCIVMIQ